jgi:DegV family protein with EDD domain
MPIKIITDSVSDLPIMQAKEQNITLVPCYINADGRSYLDGVDMTRGEFYDRLPTWRVPPTTAAPGVALFEQAYQQAVDSGATGILSIHVSERLSNIINTARLAARKFEGILPIRVIDSGQLSMGIGMQAAAAAELADAGLTLDEITARVMEKAKRIYTFAVLDTLEYLNRGGRVAHLGINLAGLLQIKPIVRVHDGKLSLEMHRTRVNAMKRLVEVAAKYAPLRQVAMVHANALERVHRLYEEIRVQLQLEGTPEFTDASPVIGTHTGPGAIGLIFEAAAE